MHRTLILPLDVLLSLTRRATPRVKHHGVILACAPLILLLKRPIQVLSLTLVYLLGGIFQECCCLCRLLERLHGLGLSDQHLVPGLVILFLSLVLLIEKLVISRS